MVRSELINKIAAERPHLSPKAVEASVNITFKTIEGTLARGERVEMRGFGVFFVGSRHAHIGQDPRNGVAISIPEKRFPRFKPPAKLHDKLNQKG
ncbi:HU family DNA-binding protein [Paracoccus sp. Ld10]|uniref:HU family DNA-binding protein n=1 Tax=Paracoccus sp. Ld10 TaxID=649158 RepID=UPI0038631AF8